MKTWREIPIYATIIEILERKNGLTDIELLEQLKKIYGDITLSELNKALMRMEIEGKIRVLPFTRSKKRIELIKE